MYLQVNYYLEFIFGEHKVNCFGMGVQKLK